MNKNTISNETSNTNDNKNKLTLDQEIQRVTADVLADGAVETIIRENVEKSITSAIERSFNYGALGTAVSKKIEEVLVPYIEGYDMAKFIPKMDTILTDIINQTGVFDAKKMMENFKHLMTIPDDKVVKAKDLFDAYCKYMADVCDTDDKEVVYDDYDPQYEPFECSMTCEDVANERSLFDRIEIVFTADTKTDCGEKSDFVVTLTRWRNDKDRNYTIGCENEPTLAGLRNLDDFEILLLRLARANTKIDASSIEDMSDEIYPSKTPEPTYE